MPSPGYDVAPNCGSNPPMSLAHWDMWGTRAGSCWVCPHLPQGTCVVHAHTSHSTCSLVCWCFISHSLFSFKPPHGAVCRCLVPMYPHNWPGSPLGFQRRWDTEVSTLVLLLSCVTVKALTHNCSANHPGSVWRSISCICVFNCPVKCVS